MAEDVREELVRDNLIGATLGHCVIEELIGEGGMARVYRARQRHLERHVAVKVLPPYYAADPAFIKRFKQEAQAMARLAHPNIIIIHDAGEEQGHLFILMEYIGGGNLRDQMERQPLPPREIVRIVHDVASALDYAHERQIIHRDVKPVNVLLDTNGRVVLSDFGVAKMLESSRAVTRTGAGVGTPEYMSPEQCRGAMVDARSDIYALGVMVYELLTGRTPFEADSYTALAHSHIYEPVPPPSRLNPRISPAVQSVVLKALEKDPAERFQKAGEMAFALEQAFAAQAPLPPSQRRATSGRVPVPGHAPTSGGTAHAQLCPRCGHRNTPGHVFCTSCGASLSGRAPTSRPVDADPSGPPVTCPQCHALNNPVHRFCTTCGSSLLVGVSGYACRACGARNPAGMRFCTQCGTPLG